MDTKTELLRLAYLELVGLNLPEFDLDGPFMRCIKAVLTAEGVEV